jgi:hypothetical protein
VWKKEQLGERLLQVSDEGSFNEEFVDKQIKEEIIPWLNKFLDKRNSRV